MIMENSLPNIKHSTLPPPRLDWGTSPNSLDFSSFDGRDQSHQFLSLVSYIFFEKLAVYNDPALLLTTFSQQSAAFTSIAVFPYHQPLLSYGLLHFWYLMNLEPHQALLRSRQYFFRIHIWWGSESPLDEGSVREFLICLLPIVLL